MNEHQAVDRRAFVAWLSALGAGVPAVLWAQTPEPITKETVAAAERVAGLEFTDAEREQLLEGLNRQVQTYAQLREVPLPNSVPPALQFDAVLPGMQLPTERRPMRMSVAPRLRRPRNLEELAFWPVRHLAELVRTQQVKPSELTAVYLDRLERFGPQLEAVITVTRERALAQARVADVDIAAARYRGPLHGIPWGAKDLLATKGYRTTWGAKPYEDQMIDLDATVVERLDHAGAILIAKLTLGALAQGDQWYGGRTRNPWNPEQGSSGSSAGSSAATVAGLVGFAIGTETLGSIVSPATRTGATGLRPTYGRVSRHGAMALSWSMDKIGPICRCVEDCALVFDAIHGPDGKDPTIRDLPFNWDATVKLADLRIGYVKSAFDQSESERDRERKPFDDATLDVLRSLGPQLIPIELPANYPVAAVRASILSIEGAAAFDELTRSDRDDLMERSSWPTTFRQARLVPAVEYIQANRIRTLLMQAMHDVMKDIDVFVTPSFGGSALVLTNLTGHPTVVVPNGFTAAETPVSISFVGKLFGEAETLAVAKAYQDATDFHTRRPRLFA